MAKAVKCPVCEGSGKRKDYDVDEYYEAPPCYGCDGKGWVEVADADAVRSSWPAEWPRSGRIDEFTTWEAL